MKNVLTYFTGALAAGAIAITACTPQQTPQGALSSGVAAAEIALTSAEKAALEYTRLPRCPGAPICSQQTAVDQIKLADQKAFEAVQAARVNEALLGAALTAIQGLTAAIPTR